MVAIEQRLPAAAPAPLTADAIPLKLRRRGASPLQVLLMTVIGAVVLAVLASHDLLSWLDRMGDRGPLLVPLQQAAAAWDGAMTRLGLASPHEALRDAVRSALDRQW